MKNYTIAAEDDLGDKITKLCCEGIYGSTDKFSHAILAQLFCPNCARDPPHSFGYASGLPPQSDEKIYANLRVYFISDSLKTSSRPNTFVGNLYSTYVTNLLDHNKFSYANHVLTEEVNG